MKLSIILPAYNEEQSIKAMIERCLGARREIIARAGVDSVEIIVVSDGSTDRTAQIAGSFAEKIKLIAYPKNQGYGKALKTGFEQAAGELVAFLDADGTCDPLSFVEMINKLRAQQADICTGIRTGKGSQMPQLRRLGNKIFCLIINFIGNTRLSDAASGIRVIKKAKLRQIYPLPNGLNFTPAMSCRAVLDPDLKLVEVEVPYREREGRSKLNLVRDGIKFTQAILTVAVTYRPLRILAPAGLVLVAISFGYGLATLAYYLQHHIVPEGDIYRLISVMVFGVSGILLIGIAQLADKAIGLSFTGPRRFGRVGKFIRRAFSWSVIWPWSLVFLLAGILMNHQTIASWLTTRRISTHWSYLVAGGYLVLLGIVGFSLGVADYIFDLLKEKLLYNNRPQQE